LLVLAIPADQNIRGKSSSQVDYNLVTTATKNDAVYFEIMAFGPDRTLRSVRGALPLVNGKRNPIDSEEDDSEGEHSMFSAPAALKTKTPAEPG